MTTQQCRWGILGTANIARKNWKAIRNAGNSAVVAVASRDRDRARRFIEDGQSEVHFFPPPFACGSYQELIDRRDVDAVYVPLPTAIRKEWILRAAQSGKHILCEKPCGTSTADLREMLDACDQNRVQFMDGVMFLHSARMALLRQAVGQGGPTGKVMRIASHFSFKASTEFMQANIRVQSDLEPLGCLGDLGWYNVRFSLCLMNDQLPEKATGGILAAHGTKGSTPVPVDFSGELFFAGGATASFYCSFLAENQQWAVVSGTQGYLHVPDFVLPFYGSEVGFETNAPLFRVHGCDFNMESHPRRIAANEYSNSFPNSQEANMIRTFADLVLTGKRDRYWPDIALKTQQVIDACLRSAREDSRIIDMD
jgi:predicted dehydrogenase